MTRARVIAATISAIAIVISGVLATSAIAANDAPRRSASAERSKYVEPSRYPIADGAYLGYVRADGLPGATVAVDFVSLTGGTLDNARSEQLVDAGALAKVGFFDPIGRPFRITVKNDAIVGVQSADDILRPLTVPRGSSRIHHVGSASTATPLRRRQPAIRAAVWRERAIGLGARSTPLAPNRDRPSPIAGEPRRGFEGPRLMSRPVP